MKGLNPAIIEKIKEIVGEDAPSSLMNFFEEILRLELKNDFFGGLESKELKSAYQSIIDKYSQDKKIIEFVKPIEIESD